MLCSRQKSKVACGAPRGWMLACLAAIACVLAPMDARANGDDLLAQSFSQTLRGGGVVSAGIGASGGLPAQGLPIVIADIPANAVVEKAYFYWVTSGGGGSPGAPTIGTPAINVPLGMAQVGTSNRACTAGFVGSYTFRADVTSLIPTTAPAVNTSYQIKDLPNGLLHDTYGASLVIIYRDPNATFQTHVVVHDGMAPVTTMATTTTSMFTGLAVPTDASAATFRVLAGHGEALADGPLSFGLSPTLTSLGTDQIQGALGARWDDLSYDVFPQLAGVTTAAAWDFTYANDCVLFAAAALTYSFPDMDGDGVSDAVDNCDLVANPMQENDDGDTLGNACDNCDLADNELQENSDTDSFGDACDNCDFTDSEVQTNSDADTLGNACDNCDLIDNETQENTDGDPEGNVCDADDDGDGVLDGEDNCPLVENPPLVPGGDQADVDNDGEGDACDGDADGDGIPGDFEETELGTDPLNRDTDGDTIADLEEVGDILDPADTDDNGVIDALDADSDNDGVNDVIEAGDGQLGTPANDTDSDGTPDYQDLDSDDDTVPDADDNCRLVANPPDIPGGEQLDADMNGIGDACQGDTDGDTIPDSIDNCDTTASLDQNDEDMDGLGDPCDGDIDGDGDENMVDNCPNNANAEQEDLPDMDGIGDVCDDDDDGDTVLDDVDNCPKDANTDQKDIDKDDIGDVCDPNSDLDADDDTILDDVDNCPEVANTDQQDTDEDDIGDACDADDDGDGVADADDTCPLLADAEQVDTDGDGDGDVCDDDNDGDGTLDPDDLCPLDPSAACGVQAPAPVPLEGGGCSCRVAGEPDDTSDASRSVRSGLLGAALIALAALRARKRSRRISVRRDRIDRASGPR